MLLPEQQLDHRPVVEEYLAAGLQCFVGGERCTRPPQRAGLE